MRWLIYENKRHHSRAALLCFDSPDDNYDILAASALCAPQKDDPDAFPVVLSPRGATSRLTDAFAGFDGASELVDEMDAERPFGKDSPVIADVVSPLSLSAMCPVNSPSFTSGWISPAGTTYSCPEAYHEDSALLLARSLYGDEAELSEGWMQYKDWLVDKKGWGKVASDAGYFGGARAMYGVSPVVFSRPLTKRQIECLVRLGIWDSVCEKMQMRLEEDARRPSIGNSQ